MRHTLFSIVAVVGVALSIGAVLQAQEADSVDGIQVAQRSFGRGPLDLTADRKFRYGNSIPGFRSNKYRQTPPPVEVDNGTRGPVMSAQVPRRIRPRDPQLEAPEPVVETEVVDDPTFSDDESSRRVLPLVEQPAASPPLVEDEPAAIFQDEPEMVDDEVHVSDIANEEIEIVETQEMAVPARVASPPPQPKPAATRDGLLFSRRSPLLRFETIGPRKTVIGKESQYKVELQNMGDVEASNVVVNVDLPEWAQITGVRASNGTTSTGSEGQPLAWSIDHVAARGLEQLLLTIVPRRSEAFDLGVAWTFAPGGSSTLIEVQEPQLALAIAGPSEVRYGDTKIYRLNISNPGTGNADNVVLQLMSLDGSNQPVTQNVGMIPAGGSKVLEVELTARQAGTITISAQATGDGDLRTNTAHDVLVRRAGLAVEVFGPEAKYSGTVATYKFRIVNPGNATADNVKVVATLPPGAEYIECSHGGRLNAASGKVNWTINSLPSENEQIFHIRVKLTSPGVNTLRVAAEADRSLADAGNASTRVEALADLKMEVNDPTGPIAVGEEMEYELRIRNRGTKAAHEVEIIAYFSEGVEPLSATGGNNQVGPGQVIFSPVPMLAVGAEVAYKIVAKANRGGSHVVRAEVQCREASTRLAVEETTHFYDTSPLSARRPTREPAGQPVIEAEPTPVNQPIRLQPR